MPALDPAIRDALAAVAEAEDEGQPATPKLIADACGIEVDDASLRTARTAGMAFYINAVEDSKLPTAAGWILTSEGAQRWNRRPATRRDRGGPRGRRKFVCMRSPKVATPAVSLGRRPRTFLTLLIPTAGSAPRGRPLMLGVVRVIEDHLRPCACGRITAHTPAIAPGVGS